jgi:transposase InsO family protein
MPEPVAASARTPSLHLSIEVLRRPLESAQYRAIRYTQRLAEAEAVASVGSTGDNYDNAMAEAFNSL